MPSVRPETQACRCYPTSTLSYRFVWLSLLTHWSLYKTTAILLPTFSNALSSLCLKESIKVYSQGSWLSQISIGFGNGLAPNRGHEQITKFMGPTWGPPGSCRPQMGPMMAPRTLLSGWLYMKQWCMIPLLTDTWASTLGTHCGLMTTHGDIGAKPLPEPT